MMCWMNFWTAVYYCLYLFGVTRSGWDLVAFCTRHTDAAQDVILFCVCGAVGQLFIFATIKQFGSLVNTLICTTRKFFNILISVVSHALCVMSKSVMSCDTVNFHGRQYLYQFGEVVFMPLLTVGSAPL